MSDQRNAVSGPLLALSELRKRAGRSQAEVASAIGTTQSGVSRIERQSDIHVSTLAEYVAALGGHLHLVVEHDGGITEIVPPPLRQHRPVDEGREFRVIWQDQESRRLIHVGWLEYTGDEFVFSYTDDAKKSPRFTPFPPFPLIDETYRSTELFAFFAVRLISAADPGFGVVLDALGLTRAGATPVELLARAPSDSPHDTIQVVPEPTEMPDGALVRTFLVSGVRHADEQDPEGLGRVVGELEEGTPLQLVAELNNPTNPRALQLTVGDKLVGWVPDYLLDEFHGYRKAGRRLSFVVDRANGPEAPWHMRLLCRLTVAPMDSP